MKKVDLEEGKELLYKSFELAPLQKMMVEVGEKAGNKILNRLQYISNLTIPRSLSWMGYDIKITPMDERTAAYVRDHAVYSNVRKIADEGMAHQYGHVLLQGQSAPNSLVGAGSAIALVQQDNDTGVMSVTRKSQLGMPNKHAKELIPDFHNFSKEQQQTREAQQDHETKVMQQARKKRETPKIKEQQLPPLKKEYQKKEVKRGGRRRLPWLRR